MQGLRASLATLMIVGLAATPAFAGPRPTTTSLGTIVTADHARVGDSAAEVGTTIFSGDHSGHRFAGNRTDSRRRRAPAVAERQRRGGE